MASSDTFTKLYKRPESEAYEYWKDVVAKEPISDNLKALVRAELVQNWHWLRRWAHREALRVEWGTTDSQLILLQDSIGHVTQGNVKLLCNKATAFYWLQTAQTMNAYGERTQMVRLIIAIMHSQWFKSFSMDELNIEYGHFLSNCVRVACTGPSTIREIIDAHLSLCRQASHLLSRDECSESRQFQCYSLLPLYQSIIVIMDTLEYKQVPLDSNNRISLSEVAKVQTVLLVCTDADFGLSAPVSLEILTPISLPLQRTDLAGVNAVRVYLKDAIQFIVDLEKREKLATSQQQPPLDAYICPEVSHTWKGDPQVKLDPDAWADACIQEADKYGYDRHNTWHVIRRAQARLVGEDVFDPGFDCFCGRYIP